MAGFIPSSQISSLTGAFETHFQTFARDIVIFKEPIKTLIETNGVSLPGFRDSAAEENYTTTTVSGVYPALVKYGNDQESTFFKDIQSKIVQGDCIIKVKEDARNFINEGKTEAFLIDNMYFKNSSDERISTLQGLTYYIYTLEKTS